MARVLRVVALVLIAATALSVAHPAAASVEDCQDLIAGLREATEGTESFTNPARDRVGLIGKLDSASDKLGEGKPADALRALESYRAKVVTLTAQGKLASADSDALIVGADAAIACVTPLVPTAPVS